MSEIRRRLLCVHTKPKEMPNYLCFTALEDGEFTLTIPSYVNANMLSYIDYSIDEGRTWVHTANSSSAITITTPTVTAGDKVYWRGQGTKLNNGSDNFARSCVFSATCTHNVEGLLTSLLYGKSAKEDDTISQAYSFHGLFYNDTNLIDAAGLLFPTNTTNYCFAGMFQQCTGLINAPSTLPATVMSNYCYSNMFYGDTSLVSIPEFTITSAAQYCCYQMFYNCTTLPETSSFEIANTATRCCQNMFYQCRGLVTVNGTLTSMTLSQYCYYRMFCGCNALVIVPTLPALTLVDYCYFGMFDYCTSMKEIRMYATNISASNCLTNFMGHSTNNGSYYRNPNATWAVAASDNLIRAGWTLFDGTEIDDEVVIFADQNLKEIVVGSYGGKMGGIYTANANFMVNGGVRIGGYYEDEITLKQIKNIKSIGNFMNYQGPNSSKITSLTSFDEFRYFPASNTTVVRGLQGMLLTHFTLPSDSVTIANYFMPNINNIRFDYPEGVVTINSVPKTTSTSVYGNAITVPKIVYPSTLTTIGNSVYLIQAYTYQDSWIVMKATTPPTASANLAHPHQLDSSTSVDKTSYPKIYVPDASVDYYKAAAYWSGIASRITPLSQFATDHPDDVI